MFRYIHYNFLNLLLLLLIFISFSYADNSVILKEVPLVIPTFGVDNPDMNPRYYTGRTYQGAQGRIYPYLMSDVLTNECRDKSYNAVYLENEYVQLCILPELGGRIFSALDKTDNYDFFYRQHVVKPALIGMLGAWISGGVEWNFPHHHRSRTFMPMDYQMQVNNDGSKTLWMTEIERRHRMKLLIGITLFPGKSLVQVQIIFFNRTPVVNSFLYFANPSVHVDSSYQVIFPPEAEFVTQHAKSEFSEWPVSNSRYGGYAYNNVDISWWKNLPNPVSFFCWDHESDYFAGYDHGKDAGTAYVADHNIAPGKKFFTFGCAKEGQMWDKMLTEADGPYLELMAGAFSDNQPDYSWIQPYEVKTLTQYWFPIQKLNGMKYANTEIAMNYEIQKNKIIIKLNTTAVQKDAVIHLFYKNNELETRLFQSSPAEPYKGEFSIPENALDKDLLIMVTDSQQNELLKYQPADKPGKEKPKPVTPPLPPEKIATNEELYLTGLRLDQFYNPRINSEPYYFEALKRDSLDYRVNTQLGIIACKNFQYLEAEKYLNRAVQRITGNYTRPKDGEALYYLGVTEKALGNTKKAYNAFYRASWSIAWTAASYYSLAELDCINHQYKLALEHIQASIDINGTNTKAFALKAAILRKLDRSPESIQTAELSLKMDPLDFFTLNELYLAGKQNNDHQSAGSRLKQLDTMLNLEAELYIELANDYINCGMYVEAIELLNRAQNSGIAEITKMPLVYYYLGYCSERLKNPDTLAYFKQAAGLSPDYIFPYCQETISVLYQAMEINPQDFNAPYYLGNLLYDKQPAKAIQAWENAASMGNTFYVLYRNLGFAYAHHTNDPDKAVGMYEKALALNNKDPRIYYELDLLYEAMNVQHQKRLALLEKNQNTINKRDDAIHREIILYVLTGKYNKAIKLLTERQFNTWEGGGDIHDAFVDAFLLRGIQNINAKHFEQASKDIQVALEYPDNLQVGEPLEDSEEIRVNYYLGLIKELKKDETAQNYYLQCVKKSVTKPDYKYYQGLAFTKLGNIEKANEIFQELVKSGERMLDNKAAFDFFAKFGEKRQDEANTARAYYIMGLGNDGLGNNDLAHEQFQKAEKLDMNNTWIKFMAENSKVKNIISE